MISLLYHIERRDKMNTRNKMISFLMIFVMTVQLFFSWSSAFSISDNSSEAAKINSANSESKSLSQGQNIYSNDKPNASSTVYATETAGTTVTTPTAIPTQIREEVLSGAVLSDSTKAKDDGSGDSKVDTEKNKKRIIVKYKDVNNIESVKNSVKKYAKLTRLDTKRDLKSAKMQVYELNAAEFDKNILDKFKASKDVEYVQEDLQVSLYDVPGDTRFPEQWGLDNSGQTINGNAGVSGVDISALDAWDKTKGSTGVVVGVLDTGVDINHEDLRDNIYTNIGEIPDNGIDDDNNGYIDDVNGWDFVGGNNTVFDSPSSDLHGTHVSGIIGAKDNDKGIRGAAPGIKIMPLKCINGNYGYTSDIIEAIEYCKIMGIKIVNCSWGGLEENGALYDAMKNSGILYICAAGNMSSNVSQTPVYPACFNIPNIISVAAIRNNGDLASYSNYGNAIDVAAPGSDILSTTPGDSYGMMSGTSMAAPFVTGTAALIKSYDAGLSVDEIAQRIKNNVVKSSKLVGKVNAGGWVDANAAIIDKASGPSVTPVATPTPTSTPTAPKNVPTPIILSDDPNIDIDKGSLNNSLQKNGKTLKPLTAGENSPGSSEQKEYLPVDNGLDGIKDGIGPQHILPQSYVNEIEPNNTSSTGMPIGSCSIFGSIESSSDTDWYVINLEANAQYKIKLAGIPQGNDFDLYVYDPSLAPVGASTFGGNSDENITLNTTTAGLYYINVYQYKFNPTGDHSYQLMVYPSSSAPDSYEPNDSGTTAKAINNDTAINATINVAADDDWYVLNASKAGKITVTLKNIPTGCDYDISVFNASSFTNAIGGSYNGGNQPEKANVLITSPGQYYIRVYSYSGYNASSSYELKAVVSTPDIYENNDYIYEMTNINMSDSILATIDNQDDVDLYKFSIIETGTYRFELQNIPEGRDYNLYIYNIYGDLYAASLFGGNVDAIINIDLDPGEYFMKVVSASGYSDALSYRLSYYRDGGFNVSVPYISANAGDIIEVPISIKNVPAEGVSNFDFTFTYDKNVLRYKGYTPGALTNNVNSEIRAAEANDGVRVLYIDQSATFLSPIKSSGEIIKLKFEVNANAVKTSTVVSYSDYCFGKRVIENSYPFIRYIENITLKPGVVSTGGYGISSVPDDIRGPSLVTVNSSNSYGDVDGNGKVDSDDYAYLRQWLIGMIREFPAQDTPQNENGFDNANVDADDNIDSDDYAYLRQWLIGMIQYFPAEILKPQIPTGLTATLDQNLSVTLSWIAPAGNVSGYRVYANGQYIASTPSTTYTLQPKDCIFNGLDMISRFRVDACYENPKCYSQRSDVLEVSISNAALSKDITIDGSLNINSGTLDLNGHTLHVKGDVLIKTPINISNEKNPKANIFINGGQLIVDGNMHLHGYSRLIMRNPKDYVLVRKSFLMNSAIDAYSNEEVKGGDNKSCLQNGLLEVKGDFSQRTENDTSMWDAPIFRCGLCGENNPGNPYNFTTSGNFKTKLSGDNKQNITFDTSTVQKDYDESNPKANQSFFKTLIITKPIEGYNIKLRYDPNKTKCWVNLVETYGDGVVPADGDEILPNVNSMRKRVAVATVSAKIYMFGGIESNGNYSNKISEYDPLIGKWNTTEYTLSKKRSDAAVARTDNGMIYVFGGYDTDHVVKEIEQFDNVINTSNIVPLDNDAARSGACAAAYGNYVYVIGGNDGSVSTNTVKVLDASAVPLAWRPNIAQMRSAREGAAAVEYDGKIYVIGGYMHNLSGADVYYDSIEVYDIASNTWSTLAAQTGEGIIRFEKRARFSANQVNGKIIVVGGFNGTDHLATVQSYNIGLNKWEEPYKTIMSPLQKKVLNPNNNKYEETTDFRSGFGSALVYSQIYIVGGENKDGLVKETNKLYPLNLPGSKIYSSSTTNPNYEVDSNSKIAGKLIRGNYTAEITDLKIESNGLPIELTRSYDSLDNLDVKVFNDNTANDPLIGNKSLLGNGWRFNYDAYIKVRYNDICKIKGSEVAIRKRNPSGVTRSPQNNDIIVRVDRTSTVMKVGEVIGNPNWTNIKFILNGTITEGCIYNDYLASAVSGAELKMGAGFPTVFTGSSYEAPYGCYDKLEDNSSAAVKFILKKADGTSYGFEHIDVTSSDIYRLVWIKDKYDNTVNISYKTVSSHTLKVIDNVSEANSIRKLTFDYPDANTIKVADNTGREVKYTLTGGNLKTVKNVYNVETEYDYLTTGDEVGSDNINLNKLKKIYIYQKNSINGGTEKKEILTNYYNKVTGRRYKEADANGKVRYWICLDALPDGSTGESKGTVERQYYDENNNKTVIKYEDFIKQPKTEIFADNTTSSHKYFYNFAGTGSGSGWIESTVINKALHPNLDNVIGFRQFDTDKYGYTVMTERDKYGNIIKISNPFVYAVENSLPRYLFCQVYKYEHSEQTNLNYLIKAFKQKEEEADIQKNGYAEYQYEFDGSGIRTSKLLRVGKSVDTYNQNVVEENASGLTKTGTWNPDNGSTSVKSNTTGNKIELAFSDGAGIRWIGYAGPDKGIANVIIDGTTYKVDTYNTAAERRVLFTFLFPQKGNHTIGIQVSGSKNSKSSGTYIDVDCFEVILSNLAVTQYSYDTVNNIKGLVKQIINPDLVATNYVYDSSSVYLASSNINGSKTTYYGFDPVGRKTYEKSPLGFKTCYFYTDNGRVNTQIAYDKDVPEKIVSAAVSVNDGYGNIIKTVTPNQCVKNGLIPILNSNPGGLTLAVMDNVKGNTNVYTLTGKLGQATTNLLNENGNIDKTYITNYGYDNAGNLQSETVTEDNVFKQKKIYEYDNMNRISGILLKKDENSNPVKLEGYAYTTSGTGLLKKIDTHNTYYNKASTDYEQTTVTTDFSAKTIKTASKGKATEIKTLNDDGTVKSIQLGIDEKNITTFDYDGLGRVTRKWVPLEYNSAETDVLTVLTRYSYSNAGNLLNEYTAPSKLIASDPGPGLENFLAKTYSYNTDGKLQNISIPEGIIKKYEYDNDGNVSKESTATKSGVFSIVIYSNNYFGKPGKIWTNVQNQDIVADGSTDPVSKIVNECLYDANGNLTGVKTSAGNSDGISFGNVNEVQYNYDDLNRRTKKTIKGATIYKEGTDLSPAANTYDTVTQKSDLTTSTTYTWDGKPSVVTDANGNTINYSYEYEDTGLVARTKQTVKTTDPNGNISYNDIYQSSYYDWGGRLIGEVSPQNFDKNKKFDQLNRIEYTYSYDAGSRTKVKKYKDTLTKFNYSEISNTPNSSSNNEICLSKLVYDEFGNVVKEYSGKGFENNKYTVYEYDFQNNLRKIYNPLTQKYISDNVLDRTFYNTKYDYDTLGHRISEITMKGFSSSESEYPQLEKRYYVKAQYKYNYSGMLLKKWVKAGDTEAITIAETDPAVLDDTYDLAGNLLKHIDGNGKAADPDSKKAVVYEYNDLQKIRSVTYPIDDSMKTAENSENYKVSYKYDVMGNLIGETDNMQKVVEYKYDTAGRQLSVTEKKSDNTEVRISRAIYDSNGNKRFDYFEAGTDKKFLNQYNYDSAGRLESTIVKVRNVDTKALKSEQDTWYMYNKDGNIITTTYLVDRSGNIARSEHTSTYDELGRLIEKKDNGQSIQKLIYNNDSNQEYSFDASNKKTVYVYDYNGRLASTIDPRGHTDSQGYDYAGNIRTKTDGRGKTTNYIYDEYDRLKYVINKVKVNGSLKTQKVKYSYDLNGNMLTQEYFDFDQDTAGRIITFEYNASNKMIKRIDHGGVLGQNQYDYTRVQWYKYNPKGELVTQYGRSSQNSDTSGVYAPVTQFSYKVNGELKQKITNRKLSTGVQLPQILIQYGYDENGNQTKVSDVTGSIDRVYDELNRVVKKTVPESTVSFVYDYDLVVFDSIKSDYLTAELSTDPKLNKITKVYDKSGRLWKVYNGIISNNDVRAEYYYNTTGALYAVKYPITSTTEATEVYDYDDGLLKSLRNTVNGVLIEKYEYEYDANHNLINKKETIKTYNNGQESITSYAYDELNRLQTVTDPTSKVTSYTFDYLGNRKTVSVNGSVTTIYDYNDYMNRLKSIEDVTLGKTTQYYYVDNTLTVKTGTNVDAAYEYDALERNTITTMGTKTIINTYNGEGLRVQKEVKNNGSTTSKIKYLYEYDKVVLELDAQNNNNQSGRNIYGLSLAARTVKENNVDISMYYMYNGHGDVTALINTATGAVAATYHYDAFGKVDPEGTTGTVNNNITYGGYQYDAETKLYYLNSRMYDPVTARFLQEDTYSGDPSDPLSLNLYTYCHNEPLMYYDPDGHYYVYINGQGYTGNDVANGEHWLEQAGVKRAEAPYIKRQYVEGIRYAASNPGVLEKLGNKASSLLNANMEDNYLSPTDYVPVEEYIDSESLQNSDPYFLDQINPYTGKSLRQGLFDYKMKTDKAFAKKISGEITTNWFMEGLRYGTLKSTVGIVDMPYEISQSGKQYATYGGIGVQPDTTAKPIIRHKEPQYGPNIRKFDSGKFNGIVFGTSFNLVASELVAPYATTRIASLFGKFVNSRFPVQMSMLESEIEFMANGSKWASEAVGNGAAHNYANFMRYKEQLSIEAGLPQGLTHGQFENASLMLRQKAGHISDDIFVQGSRASGNAKPTSDIDIGIRVSEENFDALIQKYFGKPNPGSSKEDTMLHAIATGKIQSGEVKLSSLRKLLQKELGMEVDLSVIKAGGPFDNGPFIQVKK
jgi:RHS repeat-associated protein